MKQRRPKRAREQEIERARERERERERERAQKRKIMGKQEYKRQKMRARRK